VELDIKYVCGECDQGFYKFASEWKHCPSDFIKAVTIIGALLVCLVLIGRLLGSQVRMSANLRVTFQAMQIVALFPNITVKWPSFLINIFQWMSFLVRIFFLYSFYSSNLR
jgi:hypothetical protein